MRLDLYLAEKNHYASRVRASRAVQAGCVQVNGRTVTKPSYEIHPESDVILCAPDPVPYVGRGALKLIHALDKYSINVHNLKAVDIGASTGGFTEVLLERGAARVACVDVGHGQLAQKIREDSRTAVYEDTDIRNFTVEEGTYDVACADVSFISIKMIIPHIYRLLKAGGIAVCLIKPQFEVGRSSLNKKGIVKNPALARKAAEEAERFLLSSGFARIGSCISPVKGGDGNTEFLCVCRRMTQIDV
ncbi:MAG: TlyA family RNA methyltransferase [Clostridia bacterium]